MANTFQCNLVVPANTASGGRLEGLGFGNPATPPRLNGGDRVEVVVTWAGPNPPDSVNGYFICAPTQNAGSNQAAPSPFKNGNNYVCFTKLVAKKGTSGQQYAFGSFTVSTGAPAGSYELTVVVEDARTTPSAQWSEDPEFDTTGG
jgi:hypothetical protein